MYTDPLVPLLPFVEVPPDPHCELNVPGHDRDPLGVDGAKVGVLEKANDEALGGLLEMGKEENFAHSVNE